MDKDKQELGREVSEAKFISDCWRKLNALYYEQVGLGKNCAGEMAWKLKTSPKEFGKIINGDKDWKISTVFEVARALDCKIEIELKTSQPSVAEEIADLKRRVAALELIRVPCVHVHPTTNNWQPPNELLRFYGNIGASKE